MSLIQLIIPIRALHGCTHLLTTHPGLSLSGEPKWLKVGRMCLYFRPRCKHDLRAWRSFSLGIQAAQRRANLYTLNHNVGVIYISPFRPFSTKASAVHSRGLGVTGSGFKRRATSHRWALFIVEEGSFCRFGKSAQQARLAKTGRMYL